MINMSDIPDLMANAKAAYAAWRKAAEVHTEESSHIDYVKTMWARYEAEDALLAAIEKEVRS